MQIYLWSQKLTFFEKFLWLSGAKDQKVVDVVCYYYFVKRYVRKKTVAREKGLGP